MCIRDSPRGQSREHLALARVVVEGVHELRVAEADAARLDLEKDLLRADRRYGLVGVETHLVDAVDLDGVLDGRELAGHCLISCQLSMFWPPVTGRACPVSVSYTHLRAHET